MHPPLPYFALLIALCACAGEPPQAADSEPEAPAAHTLDAPDTPPLSVDLQQVERGAQQAVETFLYVDPATLYDVYDAVLDRQDNDCPTTSDRYVDQHYWEDACTTHAGDLFHGWMLSFHTEDWELRPEQLRYDELGWLYGFGQVQYTDGRVFQTWGSASYEVFASTATQDRWVNAELGGTFLWTDERWANTWLADGLGVSYALEGWRGQEGMRLWLNGGFSRLEGTFHSVLWQGVLFDTTDGGCALEPSEGTLSLNVAETGQWVHVRFDDSCDGCGDATHDGDDLGQVCADFSRLVDWEQRPW